MINNKESQNLTEVDDWSDRWNEAEKKLHRVNPRRPEFREFHSRLASVVAGSNLQDAIEIGCYPGHLMAYVAEEFGLKVTGLEYVQEYANLSRSLLESAGIDAEVIAGDLFDDTWNPEARQWDLVMSFGLVEHFTDSSDAVEHHLQLVRPNGILVVQIPNHAGINGHIMRKVAPDRAKQHNFMSSTQLLDAFDRAPSRASFEFLCCNYIEHIGFWNCCLYDIKGERRTTRDKIVRSMGWMAERGFRWLPNSRLLAPTTLLMARRRQG